MRSPKVLELVGGVCISMLLVLPPAASCSHTPPASTAAPLVNLVSESNPALPGPVTFFVSVRAPGSSSLPSGSLTFKDGATPLGTVDLNANGLAIYTATALVPGTHQISVSYSGDSRFAPCESAVLTESVTNADGTPAVTTTTTAAVVPPPPQETEVPVVD